MKSFVPVSGLSASRCYPATAADGAAQDRM